MRNQFNVSGVFETSISRDFFIDLRSDVVTKPSAEMRKAIAKADVGNDGWGEDPTVNELQERICDLFKKEAALFVPSGTMGNQLAIRTLTRPGTEVIVEQDSHIFNYEAAAAAALAGVQLFPVKGEKGIVSKEQVENAIRPPMAQFPNTSLIALENTHNCRGGKVYPIEIIESIREVAIKNGIAMHLDGARLFNASIATGIPVYEYAKHFDTIMTCLSKGLGCPVGSILLGTQKIIYEARYFRRMYGGSMRQAGILAAAGIFALENNIERLQEDHDNAKMLGKALSDIEDFSVCLPIETNIVVFTVRGDRYSSKTLVTELANKGILIAPYNPPYLRAVTHLNISREDILFVIDTINNLFSRAA